MIENILSAIKYNKIETFLINEEIIESVELFFVKKNLDLRREKNVHHYKCTLYHDFEKDGIKMRGSSTVGIYEGMTDAEIQETIKNTYYAASFVCNPYYEIPAGTKEDTIIIKSTLAENTIEKNAIIMTEALFVNDNKVDTFLNSAELFVEKSTKHIINSKGIDVSYIKYCAKGEFVVQCIQPQDVETYQSFSYDDLETDALKNKVSESIEMTKARAKAKTTLIGGEYTVILSGRHVKDVMGYYLERSSATMIYPKYSNFNLGCEVQGSEVKGDLLTIYLTANEPYSEEGIKMEDRPLIKSGILQTIHGNSRYSYYLNTLPTGTYHKFTVTPGSICFDEMKKGKYLHVVSFSDFQMDSFSGHFGGEIRLAFLCDGDSITPITGGSINGSILESQKKMMFSRETQKEQGFVGPYAVSFPNIRVAGV